MILFDKQSAWTQDSNSNDAMIGIGETVTTIFIEGDKDLMNLSKYRTLETFSVTLVVLNIYFSAKSL